ncbi:MAG: cobyric acid synthase [Desulfobacteraceae bacterium]|nr:cobyric acid synthase [Desulfobacteraceae bacterium]
MNCDQNSKAPCIAVFGTGSDVGKSIVATAVCRWFANQGFHVAPYKAQNMSNNSGVTPEGLEMGRAQIVQAEASRIAPQVDMNPILLKPTSDVGSQVVLMGRALENNTAAEYHRKKERLFKAACDALNRLREDYDLVVIEGAGSCAEVNLMDHDIVNFRIAEVADCPVILVGDIHRGGIFAQLVGTLACLPEKNRQRIAGFIVNRFRGDINLFKDGVQWIEQQTGKPVFGVLPHYSHIHIDPEDSVVIESPKPVHIADADKAAVAVLRIPHIANFTDFDPLAVIDGVSLHFVEQPQALSMFRAVILPGTKNTRHDLEWLFASTWVSHLRFYVENGGRILGICGGYQMLGEYVADPDGIEGPPGTTPGLGLLPIRTVLKAPKTTTRTCFNWEDTPGEGYEIHMGRTEHLGGTCLLDVHTRNGKPATGHDGCAGDNGRVLGTYIHGFFDTAGITAKWLAQIGLSRIDVPETGGAPAKDKQYELLAEHTARHVDMAAIKALVDKALDH